VSLQTCPDEVKKAVNEAERRREKSEKGQTVLRKAAPFSFIKSFTS
jgi:hypothetical protein